MSKNSNYKFIRNVGKLNISKICKKNNIDIAAVYKKRTTEKKMQIVKDELYKQIIEILYEDIKDE